MRYSYECLICGKEFDLVQSMNIPHVAYHCEVESRRVWTVPHTNKDLMYNFTAPDTFKKGADIHSKRQYERLCKEAGGLNMCPSERKSIKPKKFEDFSYSREKCVDTMMKKLQKENVLHRVPELAQKYLIKKERR